MAQRVGIIAIGRNEGERLERCLMSVAGRGMPVVYVDSASTDGSAAMARSRCVEVVDLDMSLPFSAARARNEGFARLIQIAPDVQYVFFLDGDCEVQPNWIDAGVKALDEQATVAVVCGRRRERFPEKSIYNRVADIEWNTPIGQVKSCGGDAIFRVAAFKQAGGYDASVVAGEEPELCQRLRAAEWKVLRLDAEMTLHDSAMYRFGQWWKRTVRSGYGSMDVATRFGDRGLFVGHVRSARTWVYGWPIALVVASMVAILVGKTIAYFLFAAVLLALPLQALRTARGIRRRAAGWSDAIAYGFLTMIGKWANVAGQLQYRHDRAHGRLARQILYKEDATKRRSDEATKGKEIAA